MGGRVMQEVRSMNEERNTKRSFGYAQDDKSGG